MAQARILVVDDEDSVRLATSEALEDAGYEVGAVVSGEDALQRLEQSEWDIILLDLHLPGMDGMEVLRRVVEQRPDIQVITLSASGTIENAVEAIRLGAVDYIEKPFTPTEIREAVAKVLERRQLEAEPTKDYRSHLLLARQAASQRRFAVAVEHTKQAIAIDPGRPEAFNMLGVLYEVQGESHEAKKQFRVALDLDPTYETARKNLSWKPGSGELDLGDV